MWLKRLTIRLLLLTPYYQGSESSQTCNKDTAKSFQISLSNRKSFSEVEEFLRQQLKKHGGHIIIETAIDGEIFKTDHIKQVLDEDADFASNTECAEAQSGKRKTEKCSQTILTFPRDNTVEDYALYNGTTIPELTKVSMCAWLAPMNEGDRIRKGAVVSYYKHESNSGNTILVLFRNATQLKVKVHGSRQVLWNINEVRARSHFCVTISTTNRTATLFINGTSKGVRYLTKNHTIPCGGALVIGHEQDKASNSSAYVGDIDDEKQVFTGKIENLHIWDRILNETEVRKLHEDPYACPHGFIIGINETNVKLFGKVTQDSRLTPAP